MTDPTPTPTTTEATEGVETQAVEPRTVDDLRSDIAVRKAEMRELNTTSVQDPVAYAQMRKLAEDLIKGGAATADAKTPEQLLVKLQAGWEMGMRPVEASNSLYIVNGRVTIWGSALIRQLRKHGWGVEFLEETPEKCTIRVTHRKPVSRDVDDEIIEDTFLFADADASGYTKDSSGKLKVGWREGQNRKLKMRYGAASQLVKTQLPEVLGSIAGVAEIDQDAPLIVEGEMVADSNYAERIASAASTQELLEIVQSLPIAERKRATDLATARAKELEI